MAEKKDEKLVSVLFTKPHGRYSKGDLAGFDAATAEKLKTKLKVAVDPASVKAPEDDGKNTGDGKGTK